MACFEFLLKCGPQVKILMFKNSTDAWYLLLQCEMVREDIAKTRSRTAELQAQANEGTENKQKAMEELQGVESCLQTLQSSLAESNNTHEEFILKVTREECETDEELKNAQHGLQSSTVGHDCMMQV
jgi:predicted PilT family ATPase